MKALGIFLLVYGLFISNPIISLAQTVVDEPLSVVEEMPEFPGGQEKMISFLASNIKYPKSAIDSKTQGIVYVQFIVEIDGSLKSFEIVRGVQAQLDSTALSASKLMPNWFPGKNGGKAVRVRCVIPIDFRLEEEKPKKK